MTQRYRDLAFTPSVREAQRLMGTADHFAGMAPAEAKPDELTEKEAGFIAARDSFYMATVSETGWPYIQHRGGPKGFVRILSPNRLAIADFRGNRQYMSVGNLAADNRVSLFFMDYPNRRRLKVLAYASTVGRDEDGDLIVTTSLDAPIPGTLLALRGEEEPPTTAAGDPADGAVAAAGVEQ